MGTLNHIECTNGLSATPRFRLFLWEFFMMDETFHMFHGWGPKETKSTSFPPWTSCNSPYLAVCGLGCASGFSIGGLFLVFFPRHWSLQSLQFSKELSFVSAVARTHRDLRNAPYMWKCLVHSTLGLMRIISSSSCGPRAHPTAFQLPEESILPWKISTNPFFFPPPHFRNVPLSTKLLPGKVS